MWKIEKKETNKPERGAESLCIVLPQWLLLLLMLGDKKEIRFAKRILKVNIDLIEGIRDRMGRFD